jgi:hypothetical protein
MVKEKEKVGDMGTDDESTNDEAALGATLLCQAVTQEA